MKKESWQKTLNSLAIAHLCDRWNRNFVKRSHRRVLVGKELKTVRDDQYIMRRLQHDRQLQQMFEHARKPT